jgi:hypothetical protein
VAHIFVQIGNAEQQFEQPGALVWVPIHVFLAQPFDCEIHLRKQPVHSDAIHFLPMMKEFCRCPKLAERLVEVVVEAETFFFEYSGDFDCAVFGMARVARSCHHSNLDRNPFRSYGYNRARALPAHYTHVKLCCKIIYSPLMYAWNFQTHPGG